MRATPARNGKLLMMINLGEKVMTDGKTYGEWSHVKYKDSDGWVLTKFLK
ncbi:MAG: SH3 domain-containing protein [Terriglobales bacterium]